MSRDQGKASLLCLLATPMLRKMGEKNPWKRVNKLSSPCHCQSRHSEDHLSLKGLPSALSWQTEVALFLLPLMKFMRIIWDWIRISWAPSKHSISNLPTLSIVTLLVAYPSLWIYAGTEHENNTVFPQQPRYKEDLPMSFIQQTRTTRLPAPDESGPDAPTISSQSQDSMIWWHLDTA